MVIEKQARLWLLCGLLAGCADLDEMPLVGQPAAYPYGRPEIFYSDEDALAARAPDLTRDYLAAWRGDQDAEWNRLLLSQNALQDFEAGLARQSPIEEDRAQEIYALLAHLRAHLGDADLPSRAFAAEVLEKWDATLGQGLSQPVLRLALLTPGIETPAYQKILDDAMALTQARLTFKGALEKEMALIQAELDRVRRARREAPSESYARRLTALEARLERQMQILRRYR